MKRCKRSLPLLMGVCATVLSMSISEQAQKGKPAPPPPPPGDPAIAYVAERAWSTSDLMVMNADGTNQKVLLAGGTGPTSFGHHAPSWSPDSKRIAFCRNDQSGAQNGIYLINKDGSGLCKVVAMRDTCAYGISRPQWSPDGSKILYADSPGSGLNEDLYLVDATCNAAAGSKINLTNTPDIAEFNPAWSEDGTQIVTVLANTSVLDLVLYDLTGTQAVQLVNLTATGPFADYSYSDPKWARSSRRIAAATSDILVIDVTDPYNPGFNNITNTPGNTEMSPSWSPLDSQIVYVRDNNIWVMDADGSHAHQIATSGQAKVRLTDPDWRPTP